MVALQGIGFLSCLLGTAFFSAVETALTSVSLSSWDRLRRDQPSLFPAYTLWTSQPGQVLAALLFMNTLCSLGAAVVASSILRDLAVRGSWSTGVFILLASLIAGTLILVFGEILPKLYARQEQARVLRITSAVMVPLVRGLNPFLRVLVALALVFRRLFTQKPPEPLITREELKGAFLEQKSDDLSASARRMLVNLMDFDHVQVSEVMVPRAQIVAIAMERDQERMFEHIIRSGFSRVPVYFGQIDNLLGIVYAKDLLVEWRSSGLVVLEDLLRPPYRIAPDAPLSQLLQAFRQGHHLAIVADAQGRTQGLVTIEDVVETIVGDIADEFDNPPLL